MKKIVLVYDDTVNVPHNIKMIIGKASFGQIVLKRKTNFERLMEIINQTTIDIEVVNITNLEDVYSKNTVILHLFSNFVVKNSNEFKILLEKIPYINENYKITQNNDIIAIDFNNIQDYKEMLDKYINVKNLEDIVKYDSIEVNAFLDISNYNNLLTYISGGFDARFFNSLEGDEYVVTKKSTNKNKIKQEYLYYQLIPDEMKKWMVMPYDYKEDENTAQYSMERMHMTDIAIRWTHKAIDEEEFINILNKVFYYITNRTKKSVSEKEYKEIENKLYVYKVQQRIEELKKHKLYNEFDMHIKSGTEFNSIDEIFEYYLKIYKQYSNKVKEYISVIGHGDLCFANMLYSKETDLLRLIDPKGALTEEELWTNPYYDIAKLSHSICGDYDFFNCSSYSIYVDKNLKYKLEVYNNDKKFKQIFKQYIEKIGIDYNLVRIYEASLFLSMLPLHIDYPQKVLGFLLNAINILKEIEKCTKM